MSLSRGQQSGGLSKGKENSHCDAGISDESLTDRVSSSPLPQWHGVRTRTLHDRIEGGTFEATVGFPRAIFTVGAISGDAPAYRITYDLTWVDEATGRIMSHVGVVPQGVGEVACSAPDLSCWTVPADGAVVLRP